MLNFVSWYMYIRKNKLKDKKCSILALINKQCILSISDIEWNYLEKKMGGGNPSLPAAKATWTVLREKNYKMHTHTTSSMCDRAESNDLWAKNKCMGMFNSFLLKRRIK